MKSSALTASISIGSPVMLRLRSTSSAVASIMSTAWHELAHGSPGTIPGLDALRTLAVMLVFSDHAYVVFSTTTATSLPIGKFPLMYFGWTGVDLFFVLSGYLIGKQLWRELQASSSIRIGRFLVRRGLRIWPYYFIFLAFSMLFLSKGPPGSYWPDLIFLSNYHKGMISGGWSLSTEEQFYVFMPVLIIFISRFLPLRKQWIPLVILLLALPVICTGVLWAYGPHQHGADSLFFVTYAPFHTHADGLVAGVLISWLAVVHPSITKPVDFKSNIWLPSLLAVVGLALRSANPDAFAFSGLALVYGGTTLFLLRDRSLLTRIASLRVFHVLSRLSYAMYLNHFLVLAFLVPMLFSHRALLKTTAAGFLSGYALALVMSIVVATFTFIAIESPFLQLRDWLLRPRMDREPGASIPNRIVATGSVDTASNGLAPPIPGCLALAWFYHRRFESLTPPLGIPRFVLSTTKPKPLRELILSFRSVRLFLRQRPKTVLVQNPSLVSTLLVALLRPFFGYRIIMDAHGDAVIPYVHDWKLVRAITFALLRLCDLTIVTNAALAKKVASHGGTPFVLFDNLPQVPRVSRRDLGAGRHVMFVSTFAPDEPHAALFEAAQTEALRESTTFHVTGKPRPERLAQLPPKPENVRFTGYLVEHDYWQLMHSCDLVVDLTTMPDCLVCGAYEAIAAGKALILSDNLPSRELFGSAALYTDNSAASLTKLLIQGFSEQVSLEKAAQTQAQTLARPWNERAKRLSQMIQSGAYTAHY
jgi:peptidoglycan/LPS O-acetylase OafA/YrhL/glycosyltransferase involved in cell wall biosynthesis